MTLASSVSVSAPAGPQPGAVDQSAHTKFAEDDATGLGSFVQLLQGVVAPEAEAVADGALGRGSAADAPALDSSLVTWDAAIALPGLALESLVGQTARLDAQGDISLQNGTHSLQRMAHSAAGATAVADRLAGWSLAPAAAGVWSTEAMGQHMAQAIAVEGRQQQMAQAMGDAGAFWGESESSDTAASSVTNSEGRVQLQGLWRTDSETLAPQLLQRVVGQIEQWAATGAGVAGQKSERSGQSPTAGSDSDAAPWGGLAAGSGLRLTDQAVRATAPTADAAWQQAEQDAPVEDMRFWLQGHQQRAEVVVQQGGQPVRVQVAVQGQEAHVTFLSDQAQTREMLDAGLAQLREMLAEQGVALAGVQVQSGGAGAQDDEGAAPSAPMSGEGRLAPVVVPGGAAASLGLGRRSLGGLDLYA